MALKRSIDECSRGAYASHDFSKNDNLMNKPTYAINISNLNKTYSRGKSRESIEALKEVNIKIKRGSFFGLLGPNGAGKSTFINILAGLVKKTSGYVEIWGYEIETQMRDARRAIGVVPQELNIDPFFTPREVLELQAGLYGLASKHRQTEKILQTVGLVEQANAYSRSLSGGMRRRLLIAKAMVHSPPILVLDEPSAGVDVELRKKMWEHMKQINQNGTTVLLTTHYLEEAEALCDTIGIINHGCLVACEKTTNLLSSLDTKEITVFLDRELIKIPESLKSFKVSLFDKRRLVFSYRPSKQSAGTIIKAIKKCKLEISDIKSKEVDLEDIFIEITRAPVVSQKKVSG